MKLSRMWISVQVVPFPDDQRGRSKGTRLFPQGGIDLLNRRSAALRRYLRVFLRVLGTVRSVKAPSPRLSAIGFRRQTEIPGEGTRPVWRVATS